MNLKYTPSGVNDTCCLFLYYLWNVCIFLIPKPSQPNTFLSWWLRILTPSLLVRPSTFPQTQKGRWHAFNSSFFKERGLRFILSISLKEPSPFLQADLQPLSSELLGGGRNLLLIPVPPACLPFTSPPRAARLIFPPWLIWLHRDTFPLLLAPRQTPGSQYRTHTHLCSPCKDPPQWLSSFSSGWAIIF